MHGFDLGSPMRFAKLDMGGWRPMWAVLPKCSDLGMSLAGQNGCRTTIKYDLINLILVTVPTVCKRLSLGWDDAALCHCELVCRLHSIRGCQKGPKQPLTVEGIANKRFGD
jgi:hypothetical protein